ncbi:McbB family protein [Bacillus sp. NTK074B]|uniref:McbB family protein n=1 Tax=Bacillus sp. NTK074B TaxID=2802174 RepID=UPI001A8F133C|nr:McbB family protein [Bacillus sp. NTK074B]
MNTNTMNLQKEKKYILNPYVYYLLDDKEMVLQNAQGVVRIHENRLKDFIIEWDTFGSMNVPIDELNSRFGKDAEDAIHFLKTYNVIKEIPLPNLEVKKIKIYSNHSAIEQHLQNILKKDYGEIIDIESHLNDDLSANEIEVDEGDLIIVFLNPYNKTLAKEIRNRVSGIKNAYLMFSYVYNYAFYIDALYNSFLKSPCHICHMSYIESQLRIDNQGNTTYQQMIDSLYTEDPYFKVETPLTQNHQYNIVTQLVNRISKVIMLDESPVVYSEAFIESSMFDISTKKMRVDNPIHWELCDCYE